jgi:hypothetical protein
MGVFGLFKKEKPDPFNAFQIIIDTPLKNLPLPRNVPHSDFEGHDIDHSTTLVMEVMDGNEDGTTRQDVLKVCRQGEQLKLVEEEGAEQNLAIKVCRNTGEQIGYLSPGMSRTVRDNAMVEYRNSIFIAELNGGTRSNPLLGANVHIIFAHEDTPESVMNQYIESLVTNPSTTN